MADKFCVRCGSTESLEVDHIDPALKVTHSVWSWSIPRRDIELAKCQVLCTVCHKAKTKAQRPIPAHGTVSRYSSKAWKCRCDLCRKANAERGALNKAKQKEAAAQQAIADLNRLGDLLELGTVRRRAA